MSQTQERPRMRLAAQADPSVGIVCRVCGCRHFFVAYTRRVKDGIRRLKECRHCGKRRMTIERG